MIKGCYEMQCYSSLHEYIIGTQHNFKLMPLESLHAASVGLGHCCTPGLRCHLAHRLTF